MEGAIHNGANHACDSLSLPQPGTVEEKSKRRLLLIYVHGFMGSEASFQDFPAHVHDMLTGLLSDSHVVYTRIYPRYKSQGEIQSAAAQFSSWLAPHEADDLDIILLGHSLGGIVAADVALFQRHQILGLINYDVPFLGLHPRVVPTGILSSMPKKDVPPEETLADEQESLGMQPAYKPAAPDPNFDRPWRNDIRLPNRGFLKGVMHFVNKNTDNLARSVYDRVVSSAKFAGCVNNYSELRQRYRNLMELEAGSRHHKRIKFINYYTSSTGRKKPKKDDSTKESTESIAEENNDPSNEAKDKDEQTEEKNPPTSLSPPSQPTPEPSLKNLTNLNPPSRHISPTETLKEASLHLSNTSTNSHSSRNTSIDTSNSTPSETQQTPEQKLRKFILLPKNHWKYHDNAHWTAVVMKDIDEVEAHQSMFIPSCSHYDHLVGDTVTLIESWVQDEMSWRLAREALD
ncbi:hypothetical protein N7450_011301 [Penicillium hetheringtonii]|uniref:AB hydrolase-1 domain-containing protein n=1 Tax=Penicillium hetheringtonii TaxID=911720 RepID=A0AAD6DAN8_9EURO|nr:hypothetical protein N7450_011301 [Penicillium hetheringtonii]